MKAMDLWRKTLVCVCVLVCWVGNLGVKGSFVSEPMEKHIKHLTEEYKLPDSKRSWGLPVFPVELLNSKLEESEKKLLMGQALEVYETMLGKMLEQAGEQKRQGISTSLEFVQKKLKEIQTHYFPHSMDIEKVVKKLWKIKMDDVEVQSKAMWELKRLVEEASRLGNQVMKSRSRRQARRAKNPNRRRQARRAKNPRL